jgi:hypothetical protein
MASAQRAELALAPMPWPSLHVGSEPPRFPPWDARQRTLTRAAHTDLVVKFTQLGRRAGGVAFAPLPDGAALLAGSGDALALVRAALAASPAAAAPVTVADRPTAVVKPAAAAARPAAPPAAKPSAAAKSTPAAAAVGAAPQPPAAPPVQPAVATHGAGLGVDPASLTLTGGGGGGEAETAPALAAFVAALRLAATVADADASAPPQLQLLPVTVEEVAVVDDGVAEGSSGGGGAAAFNVRLHWHGRWVFVTVPRTHALAVPAAPAHPPPATTSAAPSACAPACPVQRLGVLDGEGGNTVVLWPAVTCAAWLSLLHDGGGSLPAGADLVTAALSALTGWLPLPLPETPSTSALMSPDAAAASAALASALAHLPTDTPTPAEAVREWCYASEEAAHAWARGVEAAARAERARVRYATQAAAEAGVDVAALPALLADAAAAAARAEEEKAVAAAATAAARPVKPPPVAAARRGSVPAVATPAAAGSASPSQPPSTAQLIADCAPRPVPLPSRPLLVPPLTQLLQPQPSVGGEASAQPRAATIAITVCAARSVSVDAAGCVAPSSVSRSAAVPLEALPRSTPPRPPRQLVAGGVYTLVAVRTAPLETRYRAAPAPAGDIFSGSSSSPAPAWICDGTLTRRVCGDEPFVEPLVLLRGPFASAVDGSGGGAPTPAASRQLVEAGLREIASSLAPGAVEATPSSSSVAGAATVDPLRTALAVLAGTAAFPSHPRWADPAASDVWLPLSALTAADAADGGGRVFEPASVRLLLRPPGCGEPVTARVHPPAPSADTSSASSAALWPMTLWVPNHHSGSGGSGGDSVPSTTTARLPPGVLLTAHLSAPPASEFTPLPSPVSLVVERDARFDALLEPPYAPLSGNSSAESGGRLVLPLSAAACTATAILTLPQPPGGVGAANTASGALFRLSLDGGTVVPAGWEMSVSAARLPPPPRGTSAVAGSSGDGEAHFSLAPTAASSDTASPAAPAAPQPQLPPLLLGPLPYVLSRGAHLAVRTVEATVAAPVPGAPLAPVAELPLAEMTSGCGVDSATVFVGVAAPAAHAERCSLRLGDKAMAAGEPLLLSGDAGSAQAPLEGRRLLVTLQPPSAEAESAASGVRSDDSCVVGVLAASRPSAADSAVGSWARAVLSGPQLPAAYRAAGTAEPRPLSASDGGGGGALLASAQPSIVQLPVLQWLVTPAETAHPLLPPPTSAAAATSTARRDSTAGGVKPAAAGKGGKAAGGPTVPQPPSSPPRVSSLLVARWAVSVDVSALRGASAAGRGAAGGSTARLTLSAAAVAQQATGGSDPVSDVPLTSASVAVDLADGAAGGVVTASLDLSGCTLPPSVPTVTLVSLRAALEVEALASAANAVQLPWQLVCTLPPTQPPAWAPAADSSVGPAAAGETQQLPPPPCPFTLAPDTRAEAVVAATKAAALARSRDASFAAAAVVAASVGGAAGAALAPTGGRKGGVTASAPTAAAGGVGKKPGVSLAAAPPAPAPPLPAAAAAAMTTTDTRVLSSLAAWLAGLPRDEAAGVVAGAFGDGGDGGEAARSRLQGALASGGGDVEVQAALQAALGALPRGLLGRLAAAAAAGAGARSSSERRA